MLELILLVRVNGVRTLNRILARRIEDATLRHLTILRRYLSNVDIRDANRTLDLAFRALRCERARVFLDRFDVCLRRLLDLYFNLFLNDVDDVALLPRRLEDARR